MANKKKNANSNAAVIQAIKGLAVSNNGANTAKNRKKRLNKKQKLAKILRGENQKVNNIIQSGLALGGVSNGNRQLLKQSGSLLKGFAKKFLKGSGDYEVSSNSIIKCGVENALDGARTVVKFMSNSSATRIVQRERIAVIYGTNNTNVTYSFHINPGLQTCFPWLSCLAANFEQWEPHGIVFEYKTLSSIYASSSALGQVVMATDYNPNDNTFSSINAALESEYANDATPAETFMHGIECDVSQRLTKLLTTRYTAAQSGTDLRFSDLGYFQVLTNTPAATSAIVGEIWVSYDISLYKKNLTGSQVGSNINSFYAVNKTNANSDISATKFLGTGFTTYGTLYCIVAANIVSFPSEFTTGTYGVWYWASCSGNMANFAPAAAATFVNCQASLAFANTAYELQSLGQPPGSGNAVVNMSSFSVVDILGPGASFTMANGVFDGTETAAYFLVMQLPPSYLATTTEAQ
jgi:hypothetical protein